MFIFLFKTTTKEAEMLQYAQWVHAGIIALAKEDKPITGYSTGMDPANSMKRVQHDARIKQLKDDLGWNANKLIGLVNDVCAADIGQEEMQKMLAFLKDVLGCLDDGAKFNQGSIKQAGSYYAALHEYVNQPAPEEEPKKETEKTEKKEEKKDTKKKKTVKTKKVKDEKKDGNNFYTEKKQEELPGELTGMFTGIIYKYPGIEKQYSALSGDDFLKFNAYFGEADSEANGKNIAALTDAIAKAGKGKESEAFAKFMEDNVLGASLSDLQKKDASKFYSEKDDKTVEKKDDEKAPDLENNKIVQGNFDEWVANNQNSLNLVWSLFSKHWSAYHEYFDHTKSDYQARIESVMTDGQFDETKYVKQVGKVTGLYYFDGESYDLKNNGFRDDARIKELEAKGFKIDYENCKRKVTYIDYGYGNQTGQGIEREVIFYDVEEAIKQASAEAKVNVEDRTGAKPKETKEKDALKDVKMIKYDWGTVYRGSDVLSMVLASEEVRNAYYYTTRLSQENPVRSEEDLEGLKAELKAKLPKSFDNLDVVNAIKEYDQARYTKAGEEYAAYDQLTAEELAKKTSPELPYIAAIRKGEKKVAKTDSDAKEKTKTEEKEKIGTEKETETESALFSTGTWADSHSGDESVKESYRLLTAKMDSTQIAEFMEEFKAVLTSSYSLFNENDGALGVVAMLELAKEEYDTKGAKEKTEGQNTEKKGVISEKDLERMTKETQKELENKKIAKEEKKDTKEQPKKEAPVTKEKKQDAKKEGEKETQSWALAGYLPLLTADEQKVLMGEDWNSFRETASSKEVMAAIEKLGGDREAVIAFYLRNLLAQAEIVTGLFNDANITQADKTSFMVNQIKESHKSWKEADKKADTKTSTKKIRDETVKKEEKKKQDEVKDGETKKKEEKKKEDEEEKQRAKEEKEAVQKEDRIKKSKEKKQDEKKEEITGELFSTGTWADSHSGDESVKESYRLLTAKMDSTQIAEFMEEFKAVLTSSYSLFNENDGALGVVAMLELAKVAYDDKEKKK